MAKQKEPIKFWDKDHKNYMLLGDVRDLVTRDDINGTKIATGATVAAGSDGNSAKLTVNTVDITTQDTPVAGTIDITIKGTDDTNITVAGNDITIDANPTAALDKKVDKLTDTNDLVYIHEADGTESGKALTEFVLKTDIINDLTTGGTDKALSAEQGKVLKEMIDQLSPFSVGMIQGYLLGGMATTAPAKWLICDGSSKSKATYADLYNYLKTLSVDGATCPYGEDADNFTLPTADNMIIYAGV